MESEQAKEFVAQQFRMLAATDVNAMNISVEIPASEA
jgi:hypothetical protein